MNGNRVKALWKEGKSTVQVWINTAHPNKGHSLAGISRKK